VAYYYLAAQLPELLYGQAAPMTSGDFITQARSSLSASDAALLDLCILDPEPPALDPQGPQKGSYAEQTAPSGSEFIDNWRNWERVLRLNLARLRSARLKREGGTLTDPPEYPVEAVNAAKAAVVLDSPLEAELFLDKARWDAIEDLQGFRYFAINTIYAYLLKLQILERRALFKAEEGFSEYKKLYASIVDGPSSQAERASKRNESGEPK